MCLRRSAQSLQLSTVGLIAVLEGVPDKRKPLGHLAECLRKMAGVLDGIANLRDPIDDADNGRNQPDSLDSRHDFMHVLQLNVNSFEPHAAPKTLHAAARLCDSFASPTTESHGVNIQTVPQVETDVMRVHHIHSNQRSKGRKIFEYLVNELSTWTTEDQLSISLSSTLLSKLRVESPPHPLSQARPSSSAPSAPSSAAPGGEPESGKRGEKRGHQDTHTEISSETHHSVNTDDTYDTSGEDPRPTKRRKPRSAPTALHLRQSRPLMSPSTTSLETDDAQLQADRRCPPTLVDGEHHHASQTSRGPSTVTEAVLVAEYKE
ncbi:hypothetical protein G7Y89_g12505 [Cudoniella acicularis]|uniref:Uncharacterized protein n=1 Tax=Cudoniella acicularis TaxID=354080 RepID=A0A8H4VWW6_9HELO|nr:hypothetical protein G7Y89_g12505 [Cudoniella acicularis]